MILDFQFGNYRSFRSSAKLSLAASAYDSKTLPGNVIAPTLPGITKQKFLRGAAIYGANASGKSNLIRAMFELQKLVRTSHRTEAGSGLECYAPFALDTRSRNEPTLYALRFVAEGIRYHYRVALDAERILEESLSAFPKGKEQLWYHRLWDDEMDSYLYTPEESEYFPIRKMDVEATKPNSLFLSTATNVLNHPNLGPVYGWFRDTLDVVNLAGSVTHLKRSQTFRKFESDPEKVLRYLQQADLGITDMELKKEQVSPELLDELPDDVAEQAKNRKVALVTMFHRGEGGKDYPLGFREQSSGTQRFFDLISPWIDLIEQGKVLFLDELETSLHPLLTRELIRMVMDPELNRNDAQIIFATHDPLLLDQALLRRDQIWLTEKTHEGDTILYALNEYEKPPNNRESLVRGYLSGKYGGIPFIPDSLMAPHPETVSANHG